MIKTEKEPSSFNAEIKADHEQKRSEPISIEKQNVFNVNPQETNLSLKQVLKELLDKPLEMGLVHNVNFPGCTLSECKGILYDRKVSRGMFFKDTYDVVEELEDGGIRYMVNGHYNEENEPETDFRAITDNYVSVGVVNNIGF